MKNYQDTRKFKERRLYCEKKRKEYIVNNNH